MARRWRRRDEGEPEDADEPRSRARPEREDAASDDLASRLESVTSRYERPPTAEELRAAFGRRRPEQDEEEEPKPAGGDFASRYPTETLFVATPTEPEPTVDEPVAPEDRSRTTGDYYYDPEDAWAVLGLSPGASWKDIAAAHRRLAMQHHPDRLLDATAQQRRASEDAMRDINVAYSVLRRLTGH